MIKETCIAQLKEEVQKNPTAKFYVCLRNPPTDIQYETGQIESCIALSPSENLTRDYRGNLINWTGFITKFYKEMRSPKCKKLMQLIKSESAERDIYLVCSCDRMNYVTGLYYSTWLIIYKVCAHREVLDLNGEGC